METWASNDENYDWTAYNRARAEYNSSDRRTRGRRPLIYDFLKPMPPRNEKRPRTPSNSNDPNHNEESTNSVRASEPDGTPTPIDNPNPNPNPNTIRLCLVIQQ